MEMKELYDLTQDTMFCVKFTIDGNKKRYVSRIWINERGNTDGEAVGYLVGDYLVGKVIDSCDEYINLEWWMPVDLLEATEEPATTYSNGRWYNPTNQEKADEWSRRIAKRGMV